MTFLQTVARRRDPNAVAERQVGIAGMFALCYLLFLVPGLQVTGVRPVVASVVLVAAATAVALTVRWDRINTWVPLLIPIADLLAVGLLRNHTGASASPFGALLILPVLSLGIEHGRLPVVLATLGSFLVVVLPLLKSSTPVTGGMWLRSFVTPLVFAAAALTVNELASRLRGRYQRVAELRAQQAVLLSEAQDHALQSESASNLLRQSAELMASVIDAVTEQAIIGTDEDGSVDVFNKGAERMFEQPAHGVVGRSLSSVFGEAENHAAVDGFLSLRDSARSGDPQLRDYLYRRADGRELTLQVAVTARRDAAGDVDGFLFVVTDVTAVREEARLKDEFTGLISHELRTPLSSILGYLELVTDDDENPLSVQQQSYLATVERNAQRLLRLVGDLLFTAQVEAGKLAIEARPLDLRTIVTAAVESLRPSAATAGVTLALFVPEEPIPIKGDAIRLGQACDNLISNAIKFSRRDGRVAVSATVDAGPDGDAGQRAARISVSDNGVGIPAEELDRLFSRFFRASTATANAVPGVGLGLVITKAITEAHQGRIHLASTVGQGTTFSLELPLAGAEDGTGAGRPVPGARAS
jgi:PAS domain S-box-containing protein